MAATTRRKSAEERREEILAIAIEHFAAVRRTFAPHSQLRGLSGSLAPLGCSAYT
jgi:hypothetical protein